MFRLAKTILKMNRIPVSIINELTYVLFIEENENIHPCLPERKCLILSSVQYGILKRKT